MLAGTLVLFSPVVALAATKAECVDAATKAQDLRTADKLVEARTQLLVCARDECPDAVRSDCTRWLGDVNDSIPTVVLGAKSPDGVDIVQADVSIDGKLLAHEIDGRAVSLDPGTHTIRFEVTGKPAVERQVVIRQGQKNREISVTIGEPAKPATPAAALSSYAPPPVETAPAPSPPPERERPPAETSSSQRTWALVTGGIGIVGVGIGTVFALKSKSKWNDAQTACGSGCGPGSEAYSLNDESKQAGTIAAISFVVGGAALVTGVVLWATAPSSNHRPAVTASIGPGTLNVSGRF